MARETSEDAVRNVLAFIDAADKLHLPEETDVPSMHYEEYEPTITLWDLRNIAQFLPKFE